MAAYKTNCYKCGYEVVKKKRCENPICDECKKEYQKEYREKNKEYLNEQKKEYYQENKEDIREQQKEYREKNIDKKKEYRSKPEVKDRIKEYQKEYRSKPEVKDRIKEYHSRPELKVRKKEYDKEYNSRPEIRQRRKERQKERKRTDIEFNIICRLRSRTRTVLNEYLKGQAKPQTTVQYLGCSIEYLKEHLESQFTEGMTWKKYLEGKIHIDHRIPCSWFDLNMESEREICFHYTNLQPLWAKDNLKKGARFSG